MAQPKDVEYTVVLITPSFGEERDNAEQIIEEALAHLNTFREEPGLRFAPYVTAHLEIVSTLELARDKLEEDDSVAMMILQGLDADEMITFTRECAEHEVAVCQALPAAEEPEDQPEPDSPKKREWNLVITPRNKNEEPPAHRIPETTLIAPLPEEQERLVDRVWQLIAVMALGVMEHHWTKNPPQRLFLPKEKE
jgi:hypothetical protein